MKVILRVDIDKLGKAGEVKEVKDGYAINYLIPKNLVYPATKKNLKRLEEEKEVYVKKEEKIRKQMEELKQKIESLSCNISVKVGEDDKLYGSVTSQHIVENLHKYGINLDKHQIELEEPIKKLGVYHIPVKLYPEIKANLKVWVIKE